MFGGKLVRRDGTAVPLGATLKSRDGEEFVVKGWRRPHKPSSTGRVFVVSKDRPDDFERQFFPSVFDLEIVDE